MIALLGIEMPLYVSGITILRQTQFVFNANDHSCLSVLMVKTKTSPNNELRRCLTLISSTIRIVLLLSVHGDISTSNLVQENLIKL